MPWAIMDGIMNNRRTILIGLFIYYFIAKKVVVMGSGKGLMVLALASSMLVAYALLTLKREGVLDHILSMSPKSNWETLTEITLSYSLISSMMSLLLIKLMSLDKLVLLSLYSVAISPFMMFLVLILPESLARIAPFAVAFLVLEKFGDLSLPALVVLSITSLFALRSSKIQEIVVVGWGP